jgi:hypothetical protein
MMPRQRESTEMVLRWYWRYPVPSIWRSGLQTQQGPPIIAPSGRRARPVSLRGRTRVVIRQADPTSCCEVSWVAATRSARTVTGHRADRLPRTADPVSAD